MLIQVHSPLRMPSRNLEDSCRTVWHGVRWSDETAASGWYNDDWHLCWLSYGKTSCRSIGQIACRVLHAALMSLSHVLQGPSELEDEEEGHEAKEPEDAGDHKAVEADQERLASHSRAGPRQHSSGQTGNHDVFCNPHTYCPKDWRLHGCHMTARIL